MTVFLSGCIVTTHDHVQAPPPPPPLPTAPPPPQPAYVQSQGFQVFYDALAPYGDWVNFPSYGYVWIPQGIYGFEPYNSSGYWTYTEYGYTWVSDYDWGWAPFHYGRWNFDPYYGWFWVPGNTWAPAWVTWGSSNGYYGWAPMPSNYGYGNAMPPNNQWVFVDCHHLHAHNWNNYQVNSNNTTVNNITIINNYNGNDGGHDRYHRGPRKEDVEKTVGHSIPISKIAESDKPGRDQDRNEQIRMYRPGIDQKTTATSQPKAVKPIEQLKRNDRAVPAESPNNKNVAPSQKTEQQFQPQQVQPQQSPRNVRPEGPKPPVNTEQVRQPAKPEGLKPQNNSQPSTQPVKPEAPQQSNAPKNPRQMVKPGTNRPGATPQPQKNNLNPGEVKPAATPVPAPQNPKIQKPKPIRKPTPAKEVEIKTKDADKAPAAKDNADQQKK